MSERKIIDLSERLEENKGGDDDRWTEKKLIKEIKECRRMMEDLIDMMLN